MIRAFFILATLSVLFSACTQRMVCPAFQSAFIYDKDALRKKFSYFQEDSTPKILTASKNRYLIAESVPYRKKLASLATVEMKPVYPVVPDSLTMEDDVSLAELDAAARSVIDSTYIVDVPQPPADTLEAEDADSTYVITRDREVRMLRYNSDSVSYRIDDIRFNIDQDNYMWYLRDVLVLPDVRLAQMQGKWDEEAAAKEAKKSKGGFFRNLFKKKEKKEKVEPADTLQVEPPEERSEFDFEYNENEPVQDTVTEAQPATTKKGVFSFLKKDKKRDRSKEAKTSDGPASDQPRQQKERKPKATKREEPTDLKPPDEEAEGDEGF